MPQPSDYLLNLPDPTQGVMQGMNTALGFANIKSQMDARRFQAEQAKIKAEQQEAFRADLSRLSGDLSPSALAQMIVKYPSISEDLTRAHKILSEDQQQAKIKQASGVYAALNAGQTEIAQNLLKEQATAYRNAGSEQDAKQLEDLARIAELSPETAASSVGLFLAANVGPEKFTETFAKLQEERREAELQPGVLEKQAADLGLTRAQTKKALADAEKLSGETQKALLDLEAYKQGKINLSPEKVADYETKIRGEYIKLSSNYFGKKEMYEKLMATEPTGAGDMSLVISYMKLLDPRSIVTEDEQASASNVGADVPTKFITMYNKLLFGKGSLDDKQRGEIRSQAEKIFNLAKKEERQAREGLERVSEDYGLDKERIFILDPKEIETPEQPAVIDVEARGYMRHAR